MNLKCSTLVSLVGNSPLPVLFGIQQFLAEGGTSILVHSNGTETDARRIAEVAGAEATELVPVDDPWSPGTVVDTLSRVRHRYPDAVLNYTGGTKVMSTFAVAVWSDAVDRIVYLDEPRGRWHRGMSKDPLPLEASASLEQIVAIHGVERLPSTPSPSSSVQTLRRLYDGFSDPERMEMKSLKAGYGSHRDVAKWTPEAKRIFITLVERYWADEVSKATFGVELPALFQDTWGMSLAAGLAKFISGGYLEEIAARSMASLSLRGNHAPFGEVPSDPAVSPSNLWTGQHLSVAGQRCEIDVIAWIENRLHALSVTGLSNRPPYDKKPWKAPCKNKAFEVAHRARQIGGQLSKPAFACMVDRDQLERSGFAAEIGSARFAVFGAEDFLEWLDSDFRRLADWVLG
jgi:hypothetical protein